jgi:hypothetical protein
LVGGTINPMRERLPYVPRCAKRFSCRPLFVRILYKKIYYLSISYIKNGILLATFTQSIFIDVCDKLCWMTLGASDRLRVAF